MKLLFSVPHTDVPGNDLHSTIATALKDRGHDINCIQFSHHSRWGQLDPDSEFTMRSIDRLMEKKGISVQVTTNGRWFFNWILYHRWKRVINKTIELKQFDAVISANICATPTTLAALKQDIPGVILTTGPASVRYNPESTKIDKSPKFSDLPINSQVQYPFIYMVHKMNKRAYLGAAEIIAMSEFDASITRETFGREPTKIYIPVELSEYRVSDWSPDKISLVNPRTSHKGLDIFLDISRRFPEEEFQIAGDLHDNSKEKIIKEMNNVEYMGYQEDMREVYKNTKLLVVPSSYQEGGPRIIPEAGINRIPTVGSNLGGIPDYIGKGGDSVQDHNNVDAWTPIIRKYLENKQYYEQKSQRAIEVARQFKKSDIIDKYENRLKVLCK